MTTIEQDVRVKCEVDTKQLDDAAKTADDQLKALKKTAMSFGATFTNTISAAVKSGESFEQTLKNIALQLSDLALNEALKPLYGEEDSLLTGLFTDLLKGLNPTPMANGGVVGSPTLFAAGGGLGLMGEAGPEAVLPLRRGSDGKLGVQAATNSASSSPVNITFNISTPDVAGFRKSEAQIAAMLTRTVNRGRRNL